MICKSCGGMIPEGATFCPICGKKLKTKEVHSFTGVETKRTAVPFVLLMLLLCANTLYSWYRILGYGDSLYMGIVVNSLAVLVGLVVLGISIKKGKVDIYKYHFSDILVFCCGGMIVPGILWRIETLIVVVFGYAMTGTYSIIHNIVEPLTQVPAFWLTLGIVLLGMARQGEKPSKKQILILPVILLLRSILMFLFRHQIAISWNLPMEIMELYSIFCVLYFMLYWLWPIAILWTFWSLGSNRVGMAGVIVAFCGMLVLELLLVIMFWHGMHLGMAGYGMAKGIAPLFALVILGIASKIHEKKME